MIHFVDEFLGYGGCESLTHTCFDSFWGLIRYFYGFLKETQRESRMLFTCNPKTEVFIHMGFWCDDCLDFLHEFKTQMTIL